MSRQAFDEIDLIVSPNSGLNAVYEESADLIAGDVRVRLEDAEGTKPYVFNEPTSGYQDTSNVKLSPAALARLITYAIELKGPLRVGEVGHFLQVATGDNSILLYVKMQYKGLKNLISGFSYLFQLNTDHPYNPTVSLTDSYVEKMTTLRALAETELSQYYFFENPVSTFSTKQEEGSPHTTGEILIPTPLQPSPVKESSDSSAGDESGTTDPHLQEEAIEWAHSIVAILEDRGSMPVGEIGKCLQQYSGAGNELPQHIKAKFKGLKKLIEGFKLLFCIDQSHSLNPCVSLSPDFVSVKMNDTSAEAMTPFFVFEPVKGYIPSAGSGGAEGAMATPSPPPVHTTPRTTPSKAPSSASSKSSKKNKKTPPAQHNKGSSQKYQQHQQQYQNTRGSQWGVHGGSPGYPTNAEYGYTYPPAAMQQQQYFQPQEVGSIGEDSSSFASTWTAANSVSGIGVAATALAGGESGRVPSSWSEYKKTMATVPDINTDTPDIAMQRANGLRVPPRTPPRNPSSSTTPSILIRSDSGSSRFYGGLENSRVSASPEDGMHHLAMSPNYVKYSHILNMLDIE